MKHYSCLCFFPIKPFPFCDRNFLGSVAAAESNKSILKHSCRMFEQTLIFRTFCANIEPDLGLMQCPIHE